MALFEETLRAKNCIVDSYLVVRFATTAWLNLICGDEMFWGLTRGRQLYLRSTLFRLHTNT